MLSVVFGCIFFINSLFNGVSAITDEQKAMIHNHFEVVGKECLKEHDVSVDDIKNLRAKTVPSGENAPCFLACMFRQLGIMDNAGMLQKETALELARKVFNDEDELKLIEDYLHSCSHINTESVSDGDKGCERSMMAYKCMIENASQFGIEI